MKMVTIFLCFFLTVKRINLFFSAKKAYYDLRNTPFNDQKIKLTWARPTPVSTKPVKPYQDKKPYKKVQRDSKPKETIQKKDK